MKANRFWIEIIALSSAVACALALLFAALGAATASAEPGPPAEIPVAAVTAAQSYPAQSSQAQEQTYEGMVTDTHCGAKHEAAIGKSSSDCTRSCVHAGAQFALVNGDKIYILTGDPEMLKRSAGLRSVIVGTLNGDTISVSSIGAKL